MSWQFREVFVKFWRDWIGVVVVVLAVLYVTYSSYQTEQQHQRNSCQSRINANFQQVQKVRGEIADDDRGALKILVQAITTDFGHPADLQKALATYTATQKANDAERAKHPLPELKGQC